jgi:hypothetical protein
MRQVPGLAQWLKIRYRRHRIAKFLNLLIEPFALALAIAVCGTLEITVSPSLLWPAAACD